MYLFDPHLALSLDIFNKFRHFSCAFISVTKCKVGVGSPSKQL